MDDNIRHYICYWFRINNNVRPTSMGNNGGNMKKHKIEIIETTIWTIEVEAKSKKDAVEKAEDIHINGTIKGGGRDAMTFENYTEEDYKVVFK